MNGGSDFQQLQDSPYHSDASAPAPKTPRVLACNHCQHRKVKCNRVFPCNNCIKVRSKLQKMFLKLKRSGKCTLRAVNACSSSQEKSPKCATTREDQEP